MMWKPLLDLWIDVWLLQVRTCVMCELLNCDAIEYLFLEFRVLRKWGFRVRLYDTGIRRMERHVVT